MIILHNIPLCFFSQVKTTLQLIFFLTNDTEVEKQEPFSVSAFREHDEDIGCAHADLSKSDYTDCVVTCVDVGNHGAIRPFPECNRFHEEIRTKIVYRTNFHE